MRRTCLGIKVTRTAVAVVKPCDGIRLPESDNRSGLTGPAIMGCDGIVVGTVAIVLVRAYGV